MAEHPDRTFFQAFALTLVTQVLSDIRCWAEQPHPEPLPKDWDCAYRRDLSGVIEQAVENFAGDSETVARLRRTERLARDVVSAMSSSFAVSSKPAVEWPEAYAAYFQKMLSEELFLRELRDSLDAKDRRETKRRRQSASDTHTAAPSDAVRIGRDELHDRNGVTGGGTSADTVAEPIGAAVAIGGDVYPNSSTVTAEQLAVHAKVSSRKIRKQLKDSPHETDNHGRKLFDYASILPVLQNWCETSRTRRLNSIRWPNLAENLKTLRPERKKK